MEKRWSDRDSQSFWSHSAVGDSSRGQRWHGTEGTKKQHEQLLRAFWQFSNDPITERNWSIAFDELQLETLNYLRTCSCFHFKSGVSSFERIMSNSCFSASAPKTPSWSFRKNFLITEAIVWTLKLAMLTNLPVCRKWINFFILAWWPGARNTSCLFGPSLFSFKIRTYINRKKSHSLKHLKYVKLLSNELKENYQQWPGNVRFTNLIEGNSKLNSARKRTS